MGVAGGAGPEDRSCDGMVGEGEVFALGDEIEIEWQAGQQVIMQL